METNNRCKHLRTDDNIRWCELGTCCNATDAAREKVMTKKNRRSQSTTAARRRPNNERRHNNEC